VTKRKPPGVRWETWIDRQIREGMERGEFDDLPGHGKPIADVDVDRSRDELWWVKDKLRREAVSVLPPTLALRKAVDDALVRIAATESEAAVRQIVAEINAEIVRVNSRAASGPPSTLMPFDVDEVVERWRAEHPVPPSPAPEPPSPEAREAGGGRRPRWRRKRHRQV